MPNIKVSPIWQAESQAEATIKKIARIVICGSQVIKEFCMKQLSMLIPWAEFQEAGTQKVKLIEYFNDKTFIYTMVIKTPT